MVGMAPSLPTQEQLRKALQTVYDPEIKRPITELGMVKDVAAHPDGVIDVAIYLTVAGCPLKETLTRDITNAVSTLAGETAVRVELDVMSEAQRKELQTQLRGGKPEREIPFAQPTSRTRVYAIASGKGGVGKSSVTVNLAAALASRGLSVGVVDADIYGFSVPDMLGVTQPPTKVEKMIMPPVAHGIKVISIGMFTPDNAAVVWRGPMLHRALEQFLSDVYWGDLDILLIDLPPGTGDIAISVAQLVPTAEIVVVTTPQQAAAQVAERAGSISKQTHQQVIGVVENMSWLALDDGKRIDVFGTGGGQAGAGAVTRLMGTNVPLLSQIPLDPQLRESGDTGKPFVLDHPDSPAAKALLTTADRLAVRGASLVGRSLGLTPV